MAVHGAPPGGDGRPEGEGELLNQRQYTDLPDPDTLLTFKEGCGVLRICPRLAWTLVNSGELPHLRIGRLIRFRRAALVAWIADRERKAVRR